MVKVGRCHSLYYDQEDMVICILPFLESNFMYSSDSIVAMLQRIPYPFSNLPTREKALPFDNFKSLKNDIKI
jgi:hypothetical protein